jgi:hypothetical protein
LANRLDGLRKKSVELVEEKKTLSNQSDSLQFDFGIVEELSAGLSDEDAVGYLLGHEKVLSSEIRQTAGNIDDNASQRREKVVEVDSYIESLEDNLSKLEQMKTISDLGNSERNNTRTEKRIGELQEIKELLEEETENNSLKKIISESGMINQILDKPGMVIDTFENSKEKQQLICNYANQWREKLSDDEFYALKDYTREEPNYYKNINKKLRGKALFFEDGNRERADLIHNALQKAEVPVSCTVYRGGPPEMLGKYRNITDDELVGKVLLDKGFMSTSTIKGSEFGGNVKLEIYVPAGAKGAYLSSGISAVGQGEHELLFDKGCRMKIVSVSYDIWNNRIIHARMM